MKLLVLCLTVCIALAFAEGTSDLGAIHPSGSGTVNTDDCVFAQSYSFAAILNALRHGAPGWMADDFVLADDATITTIRFWMVFAGGTSPTDYELAFALDNGDSDPTTATTVWTETVATTLVDTGDTNWGFIIWEVNCSPTTDALPTLTGGLRYWLEVKFHDAAVTDYWLVQYPVYGSYPYTGDGSVPPVWARVDTWYEPCDSFFELHTPVAIERETWGSIKSIF